MKTDKFKEQIEKFKLVINDYLDIDNLYLYNMNMPSLKIKMVKHVTIDGSEVIAYYDANKNTIYVGKDEDGSNLYHELLHAISSYKTPLCICIGFLKTDYYDNYISTGVIINEGVTEMYAERLFNDTDTLKYLFEKLIAQKLELILGEEELKRLYFNADLDGLINDLSNYIDKEEVIKLIKNTDIVYENIYINRLNIIYEDLLKDILYIDKCLLKIYVLKNIEEDNLREKALLFLSTTMNPKEKIENHLNDFNEMIDEVFSEVGIKVKTCTK